MDTVVFVDSSNISYFSNEAVLTKINAEKDTLIAQKYRVSAYPTIVLMDNKGNEIDRIVGYLPPPEFLQTIKDYRNGVGTLDDLLGKAKADSSRELAFKIADKYKYRGMPDDAMTWYSRVVAVNEKDSLAGESRMAIADMQRRAKNYDKALELFQGVLKDFPNSSFAVNADEWVGLVYVRMGDTAKAISHFEGFAERYPNEKDEIEWVAKQIEKWKNPPKADEKK